MGKNNPVMLNTTSDNISPLYASPPSSSTSTESDTRQVTTIKNRVQAATTVLKSMTEKLASMKIVKNENILINPECPFFAHVIPYLSWNHFRSENPLYSHRNLTCRISSAPETSKIYANLHIKKTDQSQFKTSVRTILALLLNGIAVWINIPEIS